MNYCSSFGTLLGLLLLCWLVFCCSGIVLFGLLVRPPTCQLPVLGHVASLVTADDSVADVVGVGEGLLRLEALVLEGSESD